VYATFLDDEDDPDYVHERAGERAGKAAAGRSGSCEENCLKMYPVDKWDPKKTREDTPIPDIPGTR
jgi:hypothetical protein